VVLIIAVLLVGHLVQRRRVAGVSPIGQAPPRLVFSAFAGRTPSGWPNRRPRAIR
jgi:hypothetical protein